MITLKDIQAAQQRIADVAIHTPLLQYAGSSLYLKPESLQPVGAFKLRGAYNKIASLTTAERQRGIIAFSSGNHAQGVAYAARALGVAATIVMPNIAPAIKVANTKAMGAKVVLLDGGGEEEWRMAAEKLAAEQQLVMIPPFNDEQIIAGQGTTGLEMLHDMPDVELILVPIGGGGLASGVATAVKLSGSSAKVIGVEPEIANDAQLSLEAGKIVALPLAQTRQTAADGMRATQIGDVTFAHLQAHLDGVVTVSEEEIAEAVRRVAINGRLTTEPSGAVSVAAALFRKQALPPSDKTVAVISGGNVDAQLFVEIMGTG